MLKSKEIRERLGLTLLDVYQGTGILPSHVSQFENGKARLSQEKLVKLSDFFCARGGRAVVINELLEAAV